MGALARGARDRERVAADLSAPISLIDASRLEPASAIAAPISSDAVAAGDGAFSTCTRGPTEWNAKSSTSSPSAPIAWARTPEGAGARSARSISGTRRRTAAVNRRRLSERAISSRPKRQLPAREPPEPRERERLAQVPRVDAAPLVALAGEREHRVRADVDVAVDPAGEVNAEERELRVGHRVHEAAHEVRPRTARARGTRPGTRSTRMPPAPSGPLIARATSSACRPAHVTTRCASIGPPVVSTTIPAAVSEPDTHRAPEPDRRAGLLDLGGERAAHVARSRRSRCRARAARRPRRRAARARADARGRSSRCARRWRRSAAPARPGAAGRPRRARPRPCRTPRGRCRGRGSTAPSRCGPRCTAAPCRTRAGSRRRRGSRPSCGRSGARRPTPPSPARRPSDRDGARRIAARRRQPDDPGTHDDHVGPFHPATLLGGRWRSASRRCCASDVVGPVGGKELHVQFPEVIGCQRGPVVVLVELGGEAPRLECRPEVEGVEDGGGSIGSRAAVRRWQDGQMNQYDHWSSSTQCRMVISPGVTLTLPQSGHFTTTRTVLASHIIVARLPRLACRHLHLVLSGCAATAMPTQRRRSRAPGRSALRRR